MYKTMAVLIILSKLTLAGTIHYDWNVSASDVQIDAYGKWDVISLDEGMPVFANGYPNLPAIARCYVLPQGATVTNVEVTNVSTISLGRALLPIPVMLLPLSGEVPGFPNYTEVHLDGMSTSFPASPIAGFKTGSKTGFRLGSYSFTPFVYEPSTGELFLITSADIEMTFDNDPLITPQMLSESQIDLATTALAAFIDNPEMLETWSPISRPDTDEDVEVVIVGNNSQQALLNELASFHSQAGYQSQFVSLQWINSNVEGYDLQEKIRNHLKDLYLNNGLCFAVVVGDSGITVRQSMLCGDGRMEPMGSCADLYYADLDGTWDSDGDHKYGEITDGVDYYTDLYVGRYPTNPSESDQLSAMISNFSNYHFSQPSGDWTTTALLIGSKIAFQGSPWDYGSIYCDSIVNTIPAGWTVASLCTDTTGYHPDNFTDLFNQGSSFVSIFARANQNGYFWNDMEWLLSTPGIDEITNGTKLPWVCSEIGSFSGGIDNNFGTECITEVLLSHGNGGAMVVSAPSAVSYLDFAGPAPGGTLTLSFADMLFSQGIVTAGVTHALAKDAFWAAHNCSYPSTVAEWTMQSVNLYGDPCTIFAGAPEGVSINPLNPMKFQVTQNPAGSVIQFDVPVFASSDMSVSVYDVAGRIVFYCDSNGIPSVGSVFSIDSSDYPSGIYSIVLRSGNSAGFADCVVLR